ncbi:MAG: DegV family protein [Bacilli bacterium]|nr:DegV family protein [Bacilli bacterium]
MRIAISTETTADLNEEVTKQYDIKTLPFSIILGEEVFKDGVKKPSELFEFYEKSGKLPRTSAINREDYKNHFEALRKEYDAVVHIALSSKISSACDSAIAVASEMENVYVIDSLSLSSGVALLVLYAKALADAGKSPEEIVKAVEERREFNKTTFVIDSLEYLYKGGRCSKLAMFGANLLKLKPEIIMPGGAMTVGKKYRGKWEKAVLDYVNDIMKDYSNPDLEHVYITRTTAPEELMSEIRDILVKRGFRNIHEAYACGTISSHCGPNTLGVLLLNDGDHPVK